MHGLNLVLLEIICCKSSVAFAMASEKEALIDWAYRCYSQGKVAKLVDRKWWGGKEWRKESGKVCDGSNLVHSRRSVVETLHEEGYPNAWGRDNSFYATSLFHIQFIIVWNFIYFVTKMLIIVLGCIYFICMLMMRVLHHVWLSLLSWRC